MRRYQISLAIKEIQIKVWDINSQIRLARIKETDNSKYGEGYWSTRNALLMIK